MDKVTKEELEKMPKEALIILLLSQSESLAKITEQNDKLIRMVEGLEERIAVMNQERFGKKTEKLSVPDGQLCIDFNTLAVLNEAEKLTEDGIPEETEEEVITYKRKKPKGKRDEDIAGLPVETEDHELPAQELAELFPDGYKRLPDEVFREVCFEPSKLWVKEHHIAVYADKKSDRIKKADRPARLFTRSLASPSIVSGAMNAKYVLGLPITRYSGELTRQGYRVAEQVVSGWMIKVSERFFSLLYDEIHRIMLKSHLIHSDETPFTMVHDGDRTGTHNYMWVFYTHRKYGSPPIVYFRYFPTRKSDNLNEVLEGYKGIIVTDGYQAYHSYESKHPDDIEVAGCWAHAKRRFSTLTKALGNAAKGTTAELACNKISAIYHEDNKYKDKSDEERLEHRRSSVAPLVDDFFEWAKERYLSVDSSSQTGKALAYCINQEKYLRKFLDNGMVPLDNNEAEREGIRPFVVGRKNWVVIDSPNGARASAVLYTIAQTAKANGLIPYYYFKHVLDEMPKHMDDKDTSFVKDLLPWSDKLPAECYPKK